MATHGQAPGPKFIDPPDDPTAYVLRKKGTNIVLPYNHAMETHHSDGLIRMRVEDAKKEGLLGKKEDTTDVKTLRSENVIKDQRIADLEAELAAAKKENTETVPDGTEGAIPDTAAVVKAEGEDSLDNNVGSFLDSINS